MTIQNSLNHFRQVWPRQSLGVAQDRPFYIPSSLRSLGLWDSYFIIHF
jgi:hypothetical protein